MYVTLILVLSEFPKKRLKMIYLYFLDFFEFLLLYISYSDYESIYTIYIFLTFWVMLKEIGDPSDLLLTDLSYIYYI